MPKYELNIPNQADAARLIAAINHMYPMPRNADGTPVYSEQRWARVKIKQILVEIVRQSETLVAQQSAIPAVDDNIIQEPTPIP